ncbi:hypothetical protein [Wolbachia endosymbiont (group B) of Xanthorhoe designata]|uniref:hypothetical protein n=1 Tax=Wolbachia endosymbiont (group B) of Xanthorhoe designata TaxID=3066184 RepID=UPI00333FBB3B
MENSRQKDLDLCRKDFGFFAFQGMLRVFNIRLNLKRENGSKNYLWLLFSSVNRLVFEKAHSQWWNIPPRCAKTTLGFIFHVAFALGNNPRAKFMYITHQRDLMREKMNELHIVLESPFYKQVFPNVKIVGRRSTRVIRTKEGGFVNGFSISGHVTGTGAGDSSLDFDEGRKYGGCIILDDLHDASCAYSRVSLISACQKFEQCITSRRNTADTPFLVIGQRISVYDIFGYLDKKSERQFEKIIIPAVLEDGTSIDENRLPMEELRIKEKAEPYVYQSQYMQDPPEPKWQIFNEKYFQKIDFAYEKIGEKDLVAFIDLNSGSLKTLDRTAVGVFQPFFTKSEFAHQPKRCGVWVDLLARKLDPATVEHDIHEFLSKYEDRLHGVVVEERGIGFKVIADLRTLLPNTLILGSRRTRSKMEVFQSCSQFVEQGHIFLEKAERDFHYLIFDEFEKIHTETEFTDDIADVLSEFIMWFPEKNRLGIPCPDDMYNHKVLKNDAISVRAKAPFSCLSVCDT